MTDEPELEEEEIEFIDEDDALARAIEIAVRKAIEEQRPGLRAELCVDAEIEVELERKWDRGDPPNPFGKMIALMEERPGAWVSPGVSVRMFACVEQIARYAYNEATR